MLSATNTITDIKTELEKDYAYYEYASDNAYSAQLTLRVTDAKLFDLVPILTEEYYNLIAAKNKVGLSLYETYLYNAEIFFACSRFLKKYSLRESQSNAGGYESITSEGYTRVITGGAVTGKDQMADYYLREANTCLANAGYKNTLQLKRGNSSLSGFEPENITALLGL